MSFFETASLVLISDFAAVSASVVSGSGANTGKAYSVKPTDGSGDFVFERGSDITATRVNKDGYIEKGRGNFLLQSNQFDTTWTTLNTSITSGQSGYDGTSDAWLLEADSDGNGRRVQQSKTQDGVATLSIYAKAGTIDWFRIEFGGAASLVYFDLTNGVLGSETNAIGKIESVGNGWYRCSAVNTSGLTATTMRYHLASDNNNIAVVSGDNIYIQDAQLEQGLVATDYIETTTAPLRAGLLEDEPRFDYHNSASASPSPSASLLLEPSSTNFIPNSEYITELLSGNRTTITDLQATSPDGKFNAAKLIPSTDVNATHQTDVKSGVLTTSYVSGDKLTISVFAKADGYDGIILRFRNTGCFTTNRMAAFDLSRGRWENISMDGTIGVMTGEVGMENYGNGWYRCYATATADATGTPSLRFPVVDVTSQDTYDETFTGDDIKAIQVYGFQLEEGSYPTSYIPTYGTAATRGAEGQTYSGFSSLIGQTEGTLFLDIDSAENSTEVFSLNRSTTNSIFLDTNSNFYRVFTWADGSIYSQTTTIANTDRIKIAIAYKSNDFAIYANGSQVSTNNTLTWTPNITIGTLNFNVGGYVTGKGVARYRQVMLIPERLSNTDCEILTGATTYSSFAAMASALNYTVYE